MTPLVKLLLKQYFIGHTYRLLFPNKLGRPYTRGRVVKKILPSVLAKLGIKP